MSSTLCPPIPGNSIAAPFDKAQDRPFGKSQGGQPPPSTDRRLLGTCVALSVLILATCGAAATCDGTDTCLQVLEANQRSMRSLSADIVQTKRLSLLTEPLVSRGRFAFQAPDQVLWQLDDPRVTVRIDAQGVHLPDTPSAEAEVAAFGQLGDMMREISSLFAGSVRGVRKSFDVTAVGDESTVRIHLKPRNEKWLHLFRAIDLTFTMPGAVMQKIQVEEALGDSLEIVFSNVHRNDESAAAMLRATGRPRE